MTTMIKVSLAQGGIGSTSAQLLFTACDGRSHELARASIGFSAGGELDGDYFEFEPAAIFVGKQREDGDTLYEQAAKVAVHPGVLLVAVVDLARYYDLPCGTGRVRYNALHDLDGQPGYVTSPWVTFNFGD